MTRGIPEPRLDPPDDGPVIAADCGHEIVGGDHFEIMWGTAGGAYEWEGKTICPECASAKIDCMTLKDLMWAFGSKFLTLEDMKNG